MTDLRPCAAHDVIRAWERSRTKTQRIAASLAAQIIAGTLKRLHELPPNSVLADDWGTSTRTVIRAKKLLADHGFTRKSPGGNYYYADYQALERKAASELQT